MPGQDSNEVRFRRVEAHGLGVHITEWPGGEPTIVMLHALGFTGRLFDPLARSLAPTYRVLCPDLRGHGKSDHPPEGYRYPNLVKDLSTLLQALRIDSVVLLGHTFGADIAMSFASVHPRRLQGLVLLDGGYRHRRDERPPEEVAEPSRDSVRYPSLEEALADARTQLEGAWSEDLERAVLDSLEVARDGTVGYRLDDYRFGLIYQQICAYDPSSALKTVKTPTLIVHPGGMEQITTQGAVAAFQARAAGLIMANAKVVGLRDGDPYAMLANPMLSVQLLTFLKGINAGGGATPLALPPSR